MTHDDTHTTHPPSLTPQPHDKRATLLEATQMLKAALDRPALDADMLGAQADILNHLFTAIMRTNLAHDMERGTINASNLDKALRVQKQCLDTIKAQSAIDYMNGLNTMRILPASSDPSANISQRTT